MKPLASILLLVIGFFVGMIFERFYYPRTSDVVITSEVKEDTSKADKIKGNLSNALKAFSFKGMNNENQKMKVTEPIDFCINSVDENGNHILGVGVTTQVLGDRPPDMPEMMHSYWLFNATASEDNATINTTIPTFSYDCKWISFEELQKKADENIE